MKSMAMIRELGRHVRALGQKLTSESIHNFGQKAVTGARVIGGKMSNTLHKVESVANAALPIAQKIASMAGYGPEVAALASAGNGIKRLVQARQNMDTVRNILNDL